MITLMMMGAVATYIAILFIALWMIPGVVQHKQTKRVIFIVWFLIPTWDVIIGYPIYKFLCATQAGVKIYKTVDNVEGFYVGDWNSKGYSKVPPKPYQGYQFVDYQEVDGSKPTGRYFRTIWKDANATKDCIRGIGFPNAYNAKLAQSGKCIVKEEIAEGEVSRWDLSWGLKTKQIARYHPINIYVLGLSMNKVGQIRDNNTNEILSEQFSINWNMGWIVSIFTSIETGHPKIKICGIDYSNIIELEHKTLKPKKGN